MDDKLRCQSCGMPIGEEFNNFGTNADGSENREYCSTLCFRDGKFTQPDLKVEDMVEMSADFMSKNLGFTKEKAQELSNEIIPNLKRWKTAH